MAPRCLPYHLRDFTQETNAFFFFVSGCIWQVICSDTCFISRIHCMFCRKLTSFFYWIYFVREAPRIWLTGSMHFCACFIASEDDLRTLRLSFMLMFDLYRFERSLQRLRSMYIHICSYTQQLDFVPRSDVSMQSHPPAQWSLSAKHKHKINVGGDEDPQSCIIRLIIFSCLFFVLFIHLTMYSHLLTPTNYVFLWGTFFLPE